MKDDVFVRIFDEEGGIVIPEYIRRLLKINTGDSLLVFIKNDVVFMRKRQPACAVCDSGNDLAEFNGKKICKSCVEGILPK